MSIVKEQSVREAIGVFDSAEDLQAAIDDLLNSGFHRAQLSLLASEEKLQSQLGYRYRKVSDLEGDPSVPRVAYVSSEAVGDGEGAIIGALAYVGAGILMAPVAAAGGTLAAIAIAAALGGGAGGAFGTWLARLLGEHHAKRIEGHLRRGGLLLWVRTWDRAEEKVALQLLSRHGGHDVHLHDCDSTVCRPVPDMIDRAANVL